MLSRLTNPDVRFQLPVSDHFMGSLGFYKTDLYLTQNKMAVIVFLQMFRRRPPKPAPRSKAPKSVRQPQVSLLYCKLLILIPFLSPHVDVIC